jgi:hypothetical protein
MRERWQPVYRQMIGGRWWEKSRPASEREIVEVLGELGYEIGLVSSGRGSGCSARKMRQYMQKSGRRI